MPSLITLANGFSLKYLTRQERLARDERRKSYWRGRLPTVNLLVLTSLNQLLFIIKILFTFHKTSYLNEEVNFTEPSPSANISWTNSITYLSDEEKGLQHWHLEVGVGHVDGALTGARHVGDVGALWPNRPLNVKLKIMPMWWKICWLVRLICRSPRLTFVEKARRLVRAIKGC